MTFKARERVFRKRRVRVSLNSRLLLIHQHDRPKVVASLHAAEFQLAKFCGAFLSHVLMNEDASFLVPRGTTMIESRNHNIELTSGELRMVASRIEQRIRTRRKPDVLVPEPADTGTTGNLIDATYTAPDRVTIE